MPTMKIGSLTLTLPSPYEPGHICTGAEARILNWELQKRLRRNLRARTKQPMNDNPSDLMTELVEYIRSYTLNGQDQVQHLAREIAFDVIRQKIKSNGGKLGNYHKSSLRAEAEKLLQGPQARDILLMAQRRVSEISKAAMEMLERKQS